MYKIVWDIIWGIFVAAWLIKHCKVNNEENTHMDKKKLWWES